MAVIIKICIDIIISDLGDIFVGIREKMGEVKLI